MMWRLATTKHFPSPNQAKKNLHLCSKVWSVNYKFLNWFYQQMQINELELWSDFIPEHIYLPNQFVCC